MFHPTNEDSGVAGIERGGATQRREELALPSLLPQRSLDIVPLPQIDRAQRGETRSRPLVLRIQPKRQ